MPKRRRHTLEFKRQVIEAASQPGVSIAAVAQAHQINPNLLHTWRRQIAQMDAASAGAPSAFLPVTVLPESVPAEPAPITEAKPRNFWVDGLNDINDELCPLSVELAIEPANFR